MLLLLISTDRGLNAFHINALLVYTMRWQRITTEMLYMLLRIYHCQWKRRFCVLALLVVETASLTRFAMADEDLSPNQHEEHEECSQVKDEDPSDEKEVARNVAIIADRIEKNDFPAVPKEMQSAVSSAEADDLLQWITKDEYVKIKSYVDEKYAEHRRTATVTDEPEKVFRARWSRNTYYVLLKEYREQFSEQNTVVDLDRKSVV